MIRVAVGDGDWVTRQGLVAVLREAGIAAHASATGPADVAIVVVGGPAASAVAAVRAASAVAPVLAISEVSDEATVGAVIDAGVSGYLVRDRLTADDLVAAVRAVAVGDVALSPSAAGAVFAAVRHRRARNDGELTAREVELLNLICEGRSNAAIAAALFVTEKTVKNHN